MPRKLKGSVNNPASPRVIQRPGAECSHNVFLRHGNQGPLCLRRVRDVLGNVGHPDASVHLVNRLPGPPRDRRRGFILPEGRVQQFRDLTDFLRPLIRYILQTRRGKYRAAYAVWHMVERTHGVGKGVADGALCV